jgi:hypothetical protein
MSVTISMIAPTPVVAGLTDDTTGTPSQPFEKPGNGNGLCPDRFLVNIHPDKLRSHFHFAVKQDLQ